MSTKLPGEVVHRVEIVEGMSTFLRACRHDVAHLIGASPEDNEEWVIAHLHEGMTLFEVKRAEAATDFVAWVDAKPEDAMSHFEVDLANMASLRDPGLVAEIAAEAAFAHVKRWAQADVHGNEPIVGMRPPRKVEQQRVQAAVERTSSAN